MYQAGRVASGGWPARAPAKGRAMDVVTVVVGALSVAAMAYLAVLLLRDGEDR